LESRVYCPVRGDCTELCPAIGHRCPGSRHGRIVVRKVGTLGNSAQTAKLSARAKHRRTRA